MPSLYQSSGFALAIPRARRQPWVSPNWRAAGSQQRDFLRDAAIAGFGVIRQPTFMAYKAIESGDLVPLLLDHTWSEINAYAVYPSARHLSRRVRAFVEFLQSRFGDEPYWDRCLKQRA